jgi:hypothetical protein
MSRNRFDLAGEKDFSAVLRLRMAELQAQQMSGFLGASKAVGRAEPIDLFDTLLGDAVSALNLGGRNMSLFDPESAYRMMTEINTRETRYQAEYSEMTDMRSALDQIRQESRSLGTIDQSTAEEEILQRMREFAGNYNQWIDRFDDALKPGGLLSGTQAAQVSQWELEQSVENRFLGAQDGVHGMRDLGFQIDPVSDRLSVDEKQFQAEFAANSSGVVSALTEFSTHFARSAELLNSEGNFVPSRLGNLSRVIDYISRNKHSLQAEFGTGDAVSPSAALAHYAEIQSLAP